MIKPYTHEEIDNMPIEGLEDIANSLTHEQRLTWAEWGYDGRTYLRLLNNLDPATGDDV